MKHKIGKIQLINPRQIKKRHFIFFDILNDDRLQLYELETFEEFSSENSDDYREPHWSKSLNDFYMRTEAHHVKLKSCRKIKLKRKTRYCLFSIHTPSKKCVALILSTSYFSQLKNT